MTEQAARANELNRNIRDYSLPDASDPEYLETAEDMDMMTTEQRQALNLRMAEWWG